LRSLVENIARRHPSPMELIREIERLRGLGYTIEAIAAKLDVSHKTFTGLTALKQAGEQRLLEAALTGTVPLWVAIDIAKTDTPETQRELLKAFESHQLNRISIRVVKRIIDQRRFLGKDHVHDERPSRKGATTSERLVKVFKRESQRQQTLVRKAKITEARLVFVITAFNKLLADEHFRTLLRAESLTTLPQSLWSQLDHPQLEVL
jgi:ParB family transcriptional regulator, chromosome partitioning protein